MEKIIRQNEFGLATILTTALIIDLKRNGRLLRALTLHNLCCVCANTNAQKCVNEREDTPTPLFPPLGPADTNLVLLTKELRTAEQGN